ncbi:unnamed protein product [Cochlearia groenlandica]
MEEIQSQDEEEEEGPHPGWESTALRTPQPSYPSPIAAVNAAVTPPQSLSEFSDKNIERGCILEMLRDALGTMGDFLRFVSKFMK